MDNELEVYSGIPRLSVEKTVLLWHDALRCPSGYCRNPTVRFSRDALGFSHDIARRA